ncbi:MAG: caspase family protein [Granulosicoccus sp.]|nr:caspase family protein [Granulosicoccus sp.]
MKTRHPDAHAPIRRLITRRERSARLAADAARSPCRSNWRAACVVVITCLAGAFSPNLLAETHAVVVSGLGGEPDYTQAFTDAAATVARALDSLENDHGRIVLLDESATREDILGAIAERALAMDGQQPDTFILVLAGHGTADSSTWRFNVVGPDITTEDLVAALNDIPAARQLVILAASASGAAIEALSQPQRVLVTATKSGGEVNAVRFPGYLADAVESTVADIDRNEILTVAEAFRFATARTAEYYEQQKLLASEHPRLVGELAADIPLALLGSLREAHDDPIVTALLGERLLLEEDFKQLVARKPEMQVVDYYVALETLLLDIARLQQAIDKATGWSDTDAES